MVTKLESISNAWAALEPDQKLQNPSRSVIAEIRDFNY